MEDLDRLLGRGPLGPLRRPPTHVEQAAEAEVVLRIARFEARFGVGRLPYWLRYFHPLLQAEYETRMAELARGLEELDRRARADAEHAVAGPPPGRPAARRRTPA